MLGYRNSARRSRELTGCRIAQGHGVCLKIDGSLLQKKKGVLLACIISR